MKNIDVRTLDKKAREQLRRTAIRMLKQGQTQRAVSAHLGVNRTTITAWSVRHAQGGDRALSEKKSGRPLGCGRSLTPAQEAVIQQKLVDHSPDQLKLKFALWNAQAVRALIKQLFLIDMAPRTVRQYLAHWGFTPQRPILRAYEQRPQAVKQWLEEQYPAIQKRAKVEGAEISWADETALSSVEHYPRGYAPRGKTPVLVLSQAKRSRINLISAITNQGKLRFMLYRESLDAQRFIEFLKRLCKEAQRKVFLIVDNLRVHHAKKVAEWVEQNSERIELFYLPSYSPELNPDEYLNADLKARMNAGEVVRTPKAMQSKLLGHLRSLQKQPARIRSYFRHEKIRYAA
jgi:transposase